MDLVFAGSKRLAVVVEALHLFPGAHKLLADHVFFSQEHVLAKLPSDLSGQWQQLKSSTYGVVSNADTLGVGTRLASNFSGFIHTPSHVRTFLHEISDAILEVIAREPVSGLAVEEVSCLDPYGFELFSCLNVFMIVGLKLSASINPDFNLCARSLW